VPELLINNQPVKAAMRPLAGFGVGAFLCEGTLAGSHAGEIVAARKLPRPRWSVAASGTSVVLGGYLPASGTQFEQHLTLIDPVAPGGLGSHPVREPEPV
jgi:hypothetical protein